MTSEVQRPATRWSRKLRRQRRALGIAPEPPPSRDAPGTSGSADDLAAAGREGPKGSGSGNPCRSSSVSTSRSWCRSGRPTAWLQFLPPAPSTFCSSTHTGVALAPVRAFLELSRSAFSLLLAAVQTRPFVGPVATGQCVGVCGVSGVEEEHGTPFGASRTSRHWCGRSCSTGRSNAWATWPSSRDDADDSSCTCSSRGGVRHLCVRRGRCEDTRLRLRCCAVDDSSVLQRVEPNPSKPVARRRWRGGEENDEGEEELDERLGETPPTCATSLHAPVGTRRNGGMMEDASCATLPRRRHPCSFGKACSSSQCRSCVPLVAPTHP